METNSTTSPVPRRARQYVAPGGHDRSVTVVTSLQLDLRGAHEWSVLTLLFVVYNASAQQSQPTPKSPCPNVFMYEPPGTEPGRWYGMVTLSTDITLHGLWLNIVLDEKADIVGNWIGDVTTTDNIDFKIENTKMKIQPGPAQAVRFFVQYNQLSKVPRLQAIRLNGREICNANNPLPAVDRPDTSPDEFSTRPIGDVPNRSEPVTQRQNRPEIITQRPSRPEGSTQRSTRPELIGQKPNRQDYATQRPSRPNTPRPQDVVTAAISQDPFRPVLRPEDRPETRPIQGRPSDNGPVYIHPENPPIDKTNANPYSIGGGQHPTQTVTQHTPSRKNPSYAEPDISDDRFPPVSVRVLLVVLAALTLALIRVERDFFAAPSNQCSNFPEILIRLHDNNPASDDDYFNGGLPSIVNVSGYQGSSQTAGSNRNQLQCGRVMRNGNPNPLVVNGRPTLEGQWPWQIALYQTQTVDSKYICGGTLISKSHVITAAHCVTRKGSTRVVNKNTLTVYLGKHNLRTSVEGVQIRLVGEITVHYQYNASSFSKDAGILKLRETVQFTEWVQPACLWPENRVDLSVIIGNRGSVVGWGFDDKGVATEELTLVEMPVVDQETCIRSYSEFFARFTSDSTYCAGYRDGTSVCNGDSGGGMVFKIDNHWYLRGLVSLSVARQNEYRCDPTHYVIFTDLAKFLPWIKQIIGSDN
ncbi:Serine protease gd [Eumeta japonica]|uniref:Serine protease gd n=1 Tax=Eumeta variegata TaxID=151549 RepID=A0A4C1W6N2_EUMVA|nr:Serine protease gd [Eumeta japonica]